MTIEDRRETPSRAEAWARDNVRLFSTGFQAEVRRRDTLRQRAADGVVRDYLEWVERTQL